MAARSNLNVTRYAAGSVGATVAAPPGEHFNLLSALSFQPVTGKYTDVQGWTGTAEQCPETLAKYELGICGQRRNHTEPFFTTKIKNAALDDTDPPDQYLFRFTNDTGAFGNFGMHCMATIR